MSIDSMPEGFEPMGDDDPNQPASEWQWSHPDGTVVRLTCPWP